MDNRETLERMRKLSNLQPLSESKVYKAEDGDVLAEGYDGDALVEMTLGELATWLGKKCPEGREDEAVSATLDRSASLPRSLCRGPPAKYSGRPNPRRPLAPSPESCRSAIGRSWRRRR